MPIRRYGIKPNAINHYVIDDILKHETSYFELHFKHDNSLWLIVTFVCFNSYFGFNDTVLGSSNTSIDIDEEI